MLSRDEIRGILQSAKTIAVVGLSDSPLRPSYSVAAYLQHQGYRIIPVNPALRNPILGEQPYATLRDVPDPIDIVDIFRKPEFVPEIVDAAVAIGARLIWMQLGVVHPEAAARAETAGIAVVMDRCLAVDHRNLLLH